jgi:hypothetical protein
MARVEYCDWCGWEVLAAAACPRCGWVMHGTPVDWHPGIRLIAKKSKITLCELRRRAGGNIRAGWYPDYRMAMQMLGQSVGIRLTWRRHGPR